MATGIEAAGLVLGSLPLLIAALEHYDSLNRRTKELFRWRLYKGKLTEELYILQISYEQAIAILLDPIATPDEIIKMKENPKCDMWTTGPIAEELQAALGRTYHPFRLTMIKIEELLSIIVGHLNILGTHQGASVLERLVLANPRVSNTGDAKRDFEFSMMVQFTMRKSAIKENLKRIEECTCRLDKWIEKADKHQNESNIARTKLVFTGSLDAIQRTASRLYCALSDSWCVAEVHHPSFLLLEQRFKTSHSKSRRLHNVIPNLEDGTSLFNLSIRPRCFPNSQMLNTNFQVPDITQRHKRVRVLAPGSQQAAVGTSIPVTDFCQHLQQLTTSTAEFHMDRGGGIRASTSECPQVRYLAENTSLEALLPRFKEKLPLAQVYSLAITLVASVLQLSSTPWLGQRWGKQNIKFLRTCTRSPVDADMTYPYLEQVFSHSDRGRSQQGTGFANTSCSSLLAIAVILLEINFGKSIEQVRRPEDVGHNARPDDGADLVTADQWFKTYRASLSGAFSGAIETGLREYHNPDANLQDLEYCSIVQAQMLQPLVEEMQYLLPGSLK